MDIQQLIDACSAAPFGKEGVVEAVHDASYRKALKLDRNSFKISPGSWKDEEKRIVEEIMKVLVPNAEGVTAELYKLNVYGPGDFFKPHVDTPRGEGMFGSLVICLPVPHTGGDLVVRHNGKSHTFSTGGGLSDSAINWAAFFSDCEHEVTPVTRGHRITLTYNLYGTQREAALDLNLELNLKTVDPTTLAAYRTFCTARDDSTFMPEGGRLAFACRHRYPHVNGIAAARGLRCDDRDGTDLGLEESMACMLKGADAAIVAAARAAGLLVKLLPLWKRMVGDRYQVGRNKEENTTEGDWCILNDGSKESDEDSDDDDELDEKLETKLGPGFCKFLTNEKPPRFKRRRLTWCSNQFQWEVGAAVTAYGNEPSVNYFYSAAVILVHLPQWDASKGERGTAQSLLAELDEDMYYSDEPDYDYD